MLTQEKLKAIKNAISIFDIYEEEKPHRVVFTTQRDFRVDDKICLPLAGIAFDVDSPFRPIIPDDTHPNCRCYYVDEITGQVVTNISSRRSTRKRNELTDIQRKELNREQKQYLTRKKENWEAMLDWHRNNLEEIKKDTKIAEDLKENVIQWELQNISVGESILDKIKKKIK